MYTSLFSPVFTRHGFSFIHTYVCMFFSGQLSLHEGFYSIYMEDWIRIFPPEQFLVMRFEDYVKNTVPVLNAIYDFLDIREYILRENSNSKTVFSH